MADDPRTEAAEDEALRRAFDAAAAAPMPTWLALDASPGASASMLAMYAPKTFGKCREGDPLRVLLADEDRAVELIARAIYDAGSADVHTSVVESRAVLAALRKEANCG